ncbi:MAG: glycosyl hydrolase 115 family protein [Chitinophagaceae bacterium]
MMIGIRVRLIFIGVFIMATVFVNGQFNPEGERLTTPAYVQYQSSSSSFCIVNKGKAAQIYVDPEDWPGVIRAAADLGDDVKKVSGTSAEMIRDVSVMKGSIIAGTIGRSRLIDRLIAENKIDVSGIKGQWESFLIQTVGNDLVIAGSDKRGTIFGIYDVSEKIGVSPWYWWADAPVKKSKSLFVKAGRYVQPSPKVKYRGIFINDEEPSFGQWSRAKFGGINSKMYTTMFELLLRLKANYLWPAMWGKSFNEDDSLNPVKADEYGIVMGTSHHEPMMRSHKEYTSRKAEVGDWNFVTNEINLRKFFTEGLERNRSFDNLITIGMRGDGDVAMGDGDDAANIQTLRNVVSAQRDIIKNVYRKDPAEIPQLWAIFTEVQRYYDAGLTVPDDVTLLFCDNNWGYIRRTGPLTERQRKGGLGMYYHIDMNGGPWNDRWINTTTIPKLREQFNLAYQTGIDRIWIVNVGDLKPKELPIDFIMRYAWNPEAIPAEKTMDYTLGWAESIFGKEHAKEVASVVSKYSKYNLWRKPEVQDPRIFSFVNYHEADSVLKQWQELAAEAEALEKKIPADAKDAYYQLVLYPAKASAGVAEIYLAAGRNNLYAKQGRVSANDHAARAKQLFELDQQLSDRYNGPMAGGKWKNMMQDIHIGYDRWNMPDKRKLPELKEVVAHSLPTMGVAVEGTEQAWPSSNEKAALPVFDGLLKQRYYIDVFNKGTGDFNFTASADQSWIRLSKKQGTVAKEDRLFVELDWNAMGNGQFSGIIEIKQGDVVVPVNVAAVKQVLPDTKEKFYGNFSGAEFSIPARGFAANIPSGQAKWILLPDLGRSAGNMGIHPVTAISAEPANAPRLEYKVYLPASDKTTVMLGILPTQDVNPARGLRIAVSIDGAEPKVIDARKGLVDTFGEYTPANLALSKVLKPLPRAEKQYALSGARMLRRSDVFDNLRWLDVELDVKTAGLHTLKVFMIDPELVLENIVVNPDNKHASYFGAPPVLHNADKK